MLSSLQEKEWKAPGVARPAPTSDEFGDVFVRDTELEGGMMAPSIATIALVCRRLLDRRRQSWLHTWTDEQVAALQRVTELYVAGTELAMLAKDAQMAIADKDKDEAERQRTSLAVLLRCHSLLRALPRGGTLILPGGWIAPKGGHGIMHTVTQQQDGSFSFTVSNTGAGLPYHPALPGTPKTRFQCTLRFDGISAARMLDDGFWLLLWRLQLVSSDEHDHHAIYDVLIPHLTGRTVAASASTTDPACEYRTPQRAGNCYYKSVLECLRYLLRREGLPRPAVKQLFFCLRREYAEMAAEDLCCLQAFKSRFGPATPLHDPSDLPMLRLCTVQLCHAAVKESRQGRLSGDELREVWQLVQRIERQSGSLPFEVDYPKLIPLLELGDVSRSSAVPPAARAFPGFECFNRNHPAAVQAVRALAGRELTAVQQAELDYNSLPSGPLCTLDECIAVSAQAVSLCSASASADSLNAVFHRIAYLHQLLLVTLPTPLPRHREQQCAWLSRPLLFREQQQLMHALLRLARLYLAAVFSIDFPANFPVSYRALSLAALVAIADRLLRIDPADVSSPVSSTYSGQHDADSVYGPSLNNGSDVSLAALTAGSECYEPAVAVARGRVLDYFNSWEQRVKKRLFPFPNSARQQTTQHTDDEPTLQFVRDVCQAAGVVIEKRGSGSKELSEVEAVSRALYTDRDGMYGFSHAGQLPWLSKAHPELGHFRDLMFLFKLSLVPMRTTCRVAPLRRWTEQELRVLWSWHAMPMSSGLVFIFGKAFDRRGVLAIQSRRAKSPASAATFIARQTQAASRGPFGFFAIPGLSLPPPPAAPSASSGVTEEDVIHCPSLPLFDGLLTVETSEKLMSALTAPYLRIPLLLGFFASQDRVDLLQHHRLQRLFCCALFEPGNWTRSDDSDPLSSVPAIAGRLGSCYGLLLNELLHSPASLLQPFNLLLQFALALDTGAFGTASSSLLLFLSAVTAQLERYTRAALQLVETREARCSSISLQQLLEHHAELLELVEAQLLPALSSYSAQVAANIPQAVLLHAHIALLSECLVARPAQPGRSLLPSLSVYLGAFSFVQTWHSSGVGIGKQLRDEEEMEEEADSSDGGLSALMAGGGNAMAEFASALSSEMENSKIKKKRLDELVSRDAEQRDRPALPEMELFASMQQLRPVVMRWLGQQAPDTVDALLNSIVRYVHGEQAAPLVRSPSSAPAVSSGRWSSLGSVPGGFVSSDGVVELQLQTGSVFSRSQQILPVSDAISRSEDFQLVLGSAPHHCSLLARHEAASSFAVFGLPYRLQYWDAAQPYEPLVGLPRVVPRELGGEELTDANYRYGTAVTTGGEWRCAGKGCKRENAGQAERCSLCGTFKPLLSEVEKRGVLYAGRTFTRRYGSTALPAAEGWVVELMEELLLEAYGDKRESFNYSLFLPTQETDAAAETVSLLGLDVATWKQVLLHRRSRLAEVFIFRCHGRHVFRSLVYTSNARLCLRSLRPGTLDRPRPWGACCRYQAGNMDEPAPDEATLLISRRTPAGEQRYVPGCLLFGLVPQALLDHFLFWQIQGEDGRGGLLIGQPRAGGRYDFGLKLSMHEQQPAMAEEVKMDDAAAAAASGIRQQDSQWEVSIEQCALSAEGEVEEEKEGGVHLLNLLSSASVDAQLHRLVLLLTRIEDAAHILVWASSPPDSSSGSSLSLLRVELPRLKLSFFPRLDADSGSLRLYSSDHAGFFLTDYRDAALVELLAPLPFSLLLENERHELRVLAVNCPMHRPRILSCPFSTELVADRLSDDWLRTVKTAYYVYTVHVSHTFLLAETLASSLFLLLLQLLARSYAAAFRLAETCELDSALSREEAFVMRQMSRALHDQHPDAHACRLKLALAVSYSEAKLELTDDSTGQRWQLDEEYAQYVRKLAHVSAACRLSAREEAQLIDLCRDSQGKIDDKDVDNRAMALAALPSPFQPADASSPALSSAASSSGTVSAVLRAPKREGASAPWFEFERTVPQFFSAGWSAGVWRNIVAYSRPEPEQLLGSALMTTVGDALNDSMVGAQHKLGFCFLYELLTGALHCRLSAAHPDCSFTLGKLLSAFAYCRATSNGEKVRSGPHYLPYAVASVLSSYFFPTSNNPQPVPIAVPMDRFPPLPALPYVAFRDGLQRGYALNRVDNPIGSFLQTVANYCAGFVSFSAEYRSLVSRQQTTEPPQQPSSITTRPWSLPRPTDTACSDRRLAAFNLFDGCELAEEELRALAGSPLSGLPLSVLLEPRRETGAAPLPSLPFDLSSHPSASSYVAKRLLQRMDGDVRAYQQQRADAQESDITGAADGRWDETERALTLLMERLRLLKAGDDRYVRQGQSVLQALANYVPDTEAPLAAEIASLAEPAGSEGQSADAGLPPRFEFIMSRYTGAQATLGLDFLTAVLLSSRAQQDVQALNPFLSPALTSLVLSLTAAVLLRTNRLGLIDRCMADCMEALRLVRRQRGQKASRSSSAASSLLSSISIQTRALSDGLTARRHYTAVVEPPPAGASASSAAPLSVSLDPRFLVFEYIFNILLRPMQVSLVRDFVGAVSRGDSSVQQMLMGAGKTTVVGPLLALILADGQSLVTQVVPSALLPMSRAVLRSRFTSLLPKRILTLEFERSWPDDPRLLARLLQRLEMARRERGLVIGTAVSVKSLMLKYVELLHQLDSADFSSLSKAQEEALQAKSQAADVLSRVLSLFRRGVLIMDEVDLLLHPLKSELNFPIGARLPLQPQPDRWLLAMHLIDALFHHQTRHLTLAALQDAPEALQLLGRVRVVLEDGRQRHALQSSPHLLLLDEAFYHQQLKPLLARWCLLFLRAKGVGVGGPQSAAALLSHLCHASPAAEAESLAALLRSFSPAQMQLLNLSRDWLGSFLPHVLRKVDRVSFGLLTADDMQALGESGVSASHTRSLVAVPFIAKDVPSRSSEFSHPDVLIGLTVLAYRVEGLRHRDVQQLVSALKAAAAEEMGPEHLRPSAVLFDRWIREAYRHRARAVKHRQQQPLSADSLPLQPRRQASAEVELLLSRHVKILPLSKFQLSDAAQLQAVYLLFRRLPSLVHHYLSSFVFPTCLLSQAFNLSASGQELGGAMLFSRRVGFSGTVSDLVPLELGECGYERGADGKVVNVLCSEAVVSWSVKEDWTVLGLLDDVAAAASSPSTRFHSLIDTGALITGLENAQVAAYLLQRGLAGFDGVVFLNRLDEAMILLRSGPPAIPLSQSGVALERRFSFYDQVHTTGIDLRHPLDATAALTLGKDMTFRDYAQGAFRMRQIGVGQRLHLIVIPEVRALIQRELRLSDAELQRGLLRHVSAWLTSNSMRMERLQFFQLCQQDLHNVWRKQAFATLVRDTDDADSQPAGLLRHRRLRARQLLDSASPALQAYLPRLAELSGCLELFRRPVDFSISAELSAQASFFQQLVSSVLQHAAFIRDEQQARDVGAVLEKAALAEAAGGDSGDGRRVERQLLDREMINEQEREQEKEKEREVLRDPRASRDDEQHEVWRIERLAHELPFTLDAAAARFAKTIGLHPFYALSSLRLAECADEHLSLPACLLVSHNLYKQSWAANPTAHRRLKNLLLVMEWQLRQDQPDSQQPAPTPTLRLEPLPSPEEQSRWRGLFELLTDGVGDRLTGSALSSLHRLLGLPQPPADSALDYAGFLQLSSRVSSSRQLPSGLRVEDEAEAALAVHRFYVAVPLAEAETLRRSIHTSQSVFSRCSIGLWTLDGQLIDFSPRFRPAAEAEHETAFQSLRFVNNELFFTQQELASLLRGIARTPLRARRRLFSASLSCRHRDRRTFDNTPVVVALQLQDELSLLRLQALLSLLCSRLTQRGLSVLDSFSVADANSDGAVDTAELFSLLRWLGLQVSGSDAASALRRLDLDGSGRLEFSEFAAMFHAQEAEEQQSLRRRSSLSLSLRRSLSDEVRRMQEAEEADSDDEADNERSRQQRQPADAQLAETRESERPLPSVPQLPLPPPEEEKTQAVSAAVRYESIAAPAASAASSPAAASSLSSSSAAAAPLAGSGWQCAVCTFLNPLTAAACLMCSAQRPPLSLSAAASTAAQSRDPFARLFVGGAEWSCPACTLSNPASAFACQACGTARAR